MRDIKSESKLQCPFCRGELEEELYNGVYECGTGCEYIRIEIECPHCKKVVWDSGTFGAYEDKEEKEEYREGFLKEFNEEMVRLLELEELNKKGK